MEREKPTFDILGRIEQERLSRGWSEYALAENSGLTQSTISTWRRRNLLPNVASLSRKSVQASALPSVLSRGRACLFNQWANELDLWAKLSCSKNYTLNAAFLPIYKGNGINFPLVSRLGQSEFLRAPFTAHPFSEWVCYRGACKNSLSTRAFHSRAVFL